jgi:hypothetical protein
LRQLLLRHNRDRGDEHADERDQVNRRTHQSGRYSGERLPEAEVACAAGLLDADVEVCALFGATVDGARDA